MSDKPLTEGLKARLDELELERRITELTAQAEDLVIRGLAKAGEATHEHRERIEDLLDKAGNAIDQRTEGRYADKVSRARLQLERGVDRLAERRPDADL
jgi:ElaB/YqjD/DUF883 family membrane-anchored ribosome-binding protein